MRVFLVLVLISVSFIAFFHHQVGFDGPVASLSPVTKSAVSRPAATEKPKAIKSPEDKLYPQGRLFPFFGFSGNAEREKAHHFTAMGPVYGRHQETLAEAEKAGLPMIFSVGIEMNFLQRGGKATLQLSDEEITRRITEQVNKVADKKSIAWWYLSPEELRPWRKDEMNYLKVASAAIRAADPLKRPIWMYDPNHRTCESLTSTAAHLDILGKGTYVDLAGYEHSRIFVRWSIEQEKKAFQQLGKKGLSLAVLQLSQDAPLDQIHLIPDRVQHDIYLSLIHGAKGVAIWSLFKRSSVKKQYDIYYMSYARAAKQLCGKQQLGQIFLFGKEQKSLKVTQVSGPRQVSMCKGNEELEAKTSTAAERNHKNPAFPALSQRELDYRGSKYLVLCNSSEKQIKLKVQVADAKKAQDLLTYKQHKIDAEGKITLWMKGLEVIFLKIE